jgi:hypothetical protein
MPERQIPGGQYFNETATRQAQIPGGGYINVVFGLAMAIVMHIRRMMGP